MKKTGFILLILLYLAAGANHFINPAFYVAIIPHYIPWPTLMNTLAGCFEILFALMLIFRQSRPLAAWGIILMLAAFMPVHIDMIVHQPYHNGSVTMSLPLAWIRILLQPVLIWWAWVYRTYR